jgi:lysophospholipase L1-like esterase
MSGGKSHFWALLALFFAIAAYAPASAPALVASVGDSFSTGAGAGSLDRGTEPGTGDGCSRSRDGWPRLLGVPAAAHFACAGATISALEQAQKLGPKATADQGSQIERLRALAASQPVTRVYVTIGLNDLGFGPILVSCVLLRSCLPDLDGNQFPLLALQIAPQTTAALKLVRQAAPEAQVVLVGYPQLTPKNVAGGPCGWLSTGESRRFRLLQGQLDATLGGAAARAGAWYISVRGAFRQHELCSSHSWVEPVTGRNPRTGRTVLLHHHHGGHPNHAGQVTIARWVRHYTAQFGPSIRPPPPPYLHQG